MFKKEKFRKPNICNEKIIIINPATILNSLEKNRSTFPIAEAAAPSIIKTNLLEFMNKFHSLDLELTNKPCSAKEALIIRILLVHEWRRIILKIPPNPSNFEDDDWPLENCRSLVASIYSKVSLKSEDWWEIPLNEKGESAEQSWNNANYKELRRALANGERPARCDVCWHNEDSGIISNRLQWEKDNWNTFADMIDVNDDYSVNNKPYWIELKVSNFCNLKCIFVYLKFDLMIASSQPLGSYYFFVQYLSFLNF